MSWRCVLLFFVCCCFLDSWCMILRLVLPSQHCPPLWERKIPRTTIQKKQQVDRQDLLVAPLSISFFEKSSLFVHMFSTTITSFLLFANFMCALQEIYRFTVRLPHWPNRITRFSQNLMVQICLQTDKQLFPQKFSSQVPASLSLLRDYWQSCKRPIKVRSFARSNEISWVLTVTCVLLKEPKNKIATNWTKSYKPFTLLLQNILRWREQTRHLTHLKVLVNEFVMTWR